MNYGEEYALWYLRLNGFFPISNFVIHGNSEIQHSSDCDILAVRFPYVYEEIGGQEDDWDDVLKNKLDFSKIIGIICEVKTGKFQKDTLFRKKYVQYSIGRLGFLPQEHIKELSDSLEGLQTISVDEHYQIAKLLVANDGTETERYFFINLEHVIDFLNQRVKKYPKEKYRDRMFFSSILFQSVIDRVYQSRK